MDVLKVLESTDDILTGIGIMFNGYTLNISETNNDMVRDFYTFHDSANMSELTTAQWFINRNCHASFVVNNNNANFFSRLLCKLVVKNLNQKLLRMETARKCN